MRDTKTKLYDSLLELARKKSIDKITVKQIAENCGVTSQTFYNHFSDKYEMVNWAYQKRVGILFEQLQADEIDWKTFLDSFLMAYENNSRFVQNALNNTHGEDSYVKRTSVFLCNCMETILCKKRGWKEAPCELKIMIKMYVSGVINAVAYWLFDDNDMSREDMVKVIDEALPDRLRDAYLYFPG